MASLPALVSLALLGLLILAGASIFLINDLKRMRREHLEGVCSVWYQRPTTRNSLKMIGYALLTVAATFWWGWSAFLPRGLSHISEMGMVCVIACILLLLASSSLILDLRKLRGERREGHALVWYRQPKILRWIGWIIFLCNSLQVVGCLERIELMQHFLHSVSYRILIPSSIISLMFVPLSLFLFFHAAILQKKMKYIKNSEERFRSLS